MSNPVVADGRLYGLSTKRKGQLVALDVATGAVRWATEGRTADQAAILLTPAHVLLLTTGGELALLRRSSGKYDEERRYEIADSATWAVPIVMRDGLIVRDASGVMRLVGKDK
jgi:outer membrane protein assembly factor BamB